MGFVDYEVDGHVAVITINRPKALNALNEDVLKDIEAAFDAVDLSEIRAIILTQTMPDDLVLRDIDERIHFHKPCSIFQGNEICRSSGNI